MAELVEWMRDYNASVPEEKHLRFYGFDMQNPQDGVVFLENYMNTHDITGVDTTNLEKLGDENKNVSYTLSWMSPGDGVRGSLYLLGYNEPSTPSPGLIKLVVGW